MDRFEKQVGGFSGKSIGVLGLAFKPNTDDIRDAQSLQVIERVLSQGGTVQAFDPVAADNVKKVFPDIEYCNSPFEAAEQTDAVIVVTEWNELRQMDLGKLKNVMKGDVLFDGRRIYEASKMRALGFDYHTIGSIQPLSH
jgi:UDPglucose 6-dehydrogenase